MQLVVAVINDPDKLDEILSGYLELGLTGATVIGRGLCSKSSAALGFRTSAPRMKGLLGSVFGS